MKIIVTGTRGIPNIQGGIETHCEELYPRLAKLGFDITVVRRPRFINNINHANEYKGVRIKDLFAPESKKFEAITHTFLSILYARKIKADIVHIHAIGPALLTPLAQLLGMKVVVTHHGPDYDRKKWGFFAKLVLHIGEYFSAVFANELIVISRVINKSIGKYRKKGTHLIFNGVTPPKKAITTDYITSIGLEPHKYIIALGRLVEEKGFDYLIEAFNMTKGTKGYKLVIAGDADIETGYSKKFKEIAFNNNVILTGFLKGEKLNELMTHAALFVLPSFHEGLPISLLEAMSYNLDVLVSDIPANIQVDLPAGSFFRVGDTEALAQRLEEKIKNHKLNVTYNLEMYNWDKITSQVADVYKILQNDNATTSEPAFK